MVNLKEIFEEYSLEDTLVFDDQDNLKYIVWNILDETERRVILLYAELGNMRDVAKEMKVSASTICIYINKIRNKIKKHL